jgi:hypothetical protein
MDKLLDGLGIEPFYSKLARSLQCKSRRLEPTLGTSLVV